LIDVIRAENAANLTPGARANRGRFGSAQHGESGLHKSVLFNRARRQ
jgi:hypothetical protein